MSGEEKSPGFQASGDFDDIPAITVDIIGCGMVAYKAHIPSSTQKLC